MTSEERLKLQLEKEKLEKQKKDYEDGLPHLFGMPWYEWAEEFFLNENHEAFLCAANQVSKSSTQIRKFIDWATDVKKWYKRWPGLFDGQIPNQFWYLYPTRDVATIEWETKWVQFMPKGWAKEHPIYGWKEEYKNKQIQHVKFNCGVTIYFKTYSQDVQDLQSGSVFMMGYDEELPVELLGELQARLNGTDGYFSGVFTATLGQDYWRRTMEPENEDEELHKDAWKMEVSLFDCQKYKDGSNSPWTPQKIRRAIARCATKADEKRRIYGKFAVSSGRKFETFERERNVVKPFKIDASWHIYEAVDVGSGGDSGHPAAISFIAVRPDFKFGAVFRAWRGDKIATASGDIYLKHVELRAKLKPVMQIYDFGSKEFGLVAQGNSDPFIKANKGKDEGVGVLNVLFKHGMLVLFSGDPEIEKASVEFTSLLSSTPKTKAKDDLADTIQYAAAMIPWDFSDIEAGVIDYDEDANPRPKAPSKSSAELELDERRAFNLGLSDADKDPIEEELDYYNDLYGT